MRGIAELAGRISAPTLERSARGDRAGVITSGRNRIKDRVARLELSVAGNSEVGGCDVLVVGSVSRGDLDFILAKTESIIAADCHARSAGEHMVRVLIYLTLN